MPMQAQRGGGGVAANPFATSALGRVGWSKPRSGRFTFGKEPGGLRSRYAGALKMSPPREFDLQTVQSVDESLHRLSYAV
jgi:hypothetical protein